MKSLTGQMTGEAFFCSYLRQKVGTFWIQIRVAYTSAGMLTRWMWFLKVREHVFLVAC